MLEQDGHLGQPPPPRPLLPAAPSGFSPALTPTQSSSGPVLTGQLESGCRRLCYFTSNSAPQPDIHPNPEHPPHRPPYTLTRPSPTPCPQLHGVPCPPGPFSLPFLGVPEPPRAHRLHPSRACALPPGSWAAPCTPLLPAWWWDDPTAQHSLSVRQAEVDRERCPPSGSPCRLKRSPLACVCLRGGGELPGWAAVGLGLGQPRRAVSAPPQPLTARPHRA